MTCGTSKGVICETDLDDEPFFVEYIPDSQTLWRAAWEFRVSKTSKFVFPVRVIEFHETHCIVLTIIGPKRRTVVVGEYL